MGRTAARLMYSARFATLSAKLTELEKTLKRHARAAREDPESWAPADELQHAIGRIDELIEMLSVSET
jgi:hypothetical protein